MLFPAKIQVLICIIGMDIIKRKHYVVKIFLCEDKTKRQWKFVHSYFILYDLFSFSSSFLVLHLVKSNLYNSAPKILTSSCQHLWFLAESLIWQQNLLFVRKDRLDVLGELTHRPPTQEQPWTNDWKETVYKYLSCFALPGGLTQRHLFYLGS